MPIQALTDYFDVAIVTDDIDGSSSSRQQLLLRVHELNGRQHDIKVKTRSYAKGERHHFRHDLLPGVTVGELGAIELTIVGEKKDKMKKRRWRLQRIDIALVSVGTTSRAAWTFPCNSYIETTRRVLFESSAAITSTGQLADFRTEELERLKRMYVYDVAHGGPGPTFDDKKTSKPIDATHDYSARGLPAHFGGGETGRGLYSDLPSDEQWCNHAEKRGYIVDFHDALKQRIKSMELPEDKSLKKVKLWGSEDTDKRDKKTGQLPAGSFKPWDSLTELNDLYRELPNAYVPAFFKSDVEFARQFLQGANPTRIELCDAEYLTTHSYARPAEIIPSELLEGLDCATVIAQRRLYVVNYTFLEQQRFQPPPVTDGRNYLASPLTFLFVNAHHTLMPVAIQLHKNGRAFFPPRRGRSKKDLDADAEAAARARGDRSLGTSRDSELDDAGGGGGSSSSSIAARAARQHRDWLNSDTLGRDVAGGSDPTSTTAGERFTLAAPTSARLSGGAGIANRGQSAEQRETVERLRRESAEKAREAERLAQQLERQQSSAVSDTMAPTASTPSTSTSPVSGGGSGFRTPAAIEAGPTLTDWLLAKAFVANADAVFHQSVSMWLLSHAVIEPYVMSLRRNVSVMHPVHKLLAPHFQDVLAVNAVARAGLVDPKGVLSTVLTPGPALLEVPRFYYEGWRLVDQSLPAQAKRRGVWKNDVINGSNYRWLADAKLNWHALSKYVGQYTSLYYGCDADVLGDDELQEWWAEVRITGHAGTANDTTTCTTRAQLTEALSTLIWLTTFQHSSLTASQFVYGGYVPNRPFTMKASPAELWQSGKDVPWDAKKLSRTEIDWTKMLRFLPSKRESIQQFAITSLFSNFSSHSSYISDVDWHARWFTDHDAQQIVCQFQAALDAVNRVIDERNADADISAMHASGAAAYGPIGVGGGKLVTPSSSMADRELAEATAKDDDAAGDDVGVGDRGGGNHDISGVGKQIVTVVIDERDAGTVRKGKRAAAAARGSKGGTKKNSVSGDLPSLPFVFMRPSQITISPAN